MISQNSFDKRVMDFINQSNKFDVKMILVGGAAVNFHGYQRHSADIDFWIELSSENLDKLKKAIIHLGYEIQDFPKEVKSGNQNISIKISPVFEIELITRFNPGKTFNEALNSSVLVENAGLHYHVLSFEDLINSKIASPRSKDKLDIIELQRIKKEQDRKPD